MVHLAIIVVIHLAIHLTVHLVMVHLAVVHLTVIHGHIAIHLHLHVLFRRDVACELRVSHAEDHGQVGEQDEKDHEAQVFLKLGRFIRTLEDDP